MDNIILPLQRILRGNRFWQDTAIPVRLYGTYDSDNVEAVVYRLDSRENFLLGI